MAAYKLPTVPIISLLVLMLTSLCQANDGDNSASNKSYYGKNLFEIGKRYNKPLLRLIGKTFMEYECINNRCSQWSSWSDCRTIVGTFGVRTRDRKCGRSDLACKPKVVPRNETESEVCELFCLPSYTLTVDGFCLKFHNASNVDRNAAETACRADKGFLVNINSQRKWDAIEDYLIANRVSNHLWIDGEKKNVNSDWEFSYENDITGFSKWYTGQPTNGTTELCMGILYSSSIYGIMDVSCSPSYYFICEITPL